MSQKTRVLEKLEEALESERRAVQAERLVAHYRKVLGDVKLVLNANYGSAVTVRDRALALIEREENGPSQRDVDARTQHEPSCVGEPHMTTEPTAPFHELTKLLPREDEGTPQERAQRYEEIRRLARERFDKLNHNIELCSLGDRPQSPSAATIQELIDLNKFTNYLTSKLPEKEKETPPMDPKAKPDPRTINATVTVMVRIPVQSVWTPETTVFQVEKQAINDAREIVRRALDASGARLAEMSVGKVEMFFVEKA